MTHHGGMRPLVTALTLCGLLLSGCTVASADMATPATPMTTTTTPSAASTMTPSTMATVASTESPALSPAETPSASAPLMLTGEPLMTPTPSGNLTAAPDPAPVGSFVLGDSISLTVAPTLSRLGYPVTGRVGQPATSEFLRQHLASSTAQSAPAWVIVLGTNNRGDEADIARLDEWLATIKDLRSGRPRQHVYWVTPHRPLEYTGGLRDYDLSVFNTALATRADELRWLHVVDFSTPAGKHPEWFAQDGGRLHPGADGQAALAALIAGPDAQLADQPRAITELTWPTPTPTPTPTPELPLEPVPAELPQESVQAPDITEQGEFVNE